MQERDNKNRTFSRPLIVLGFNDMSTLVGHFVSSPREQEKRDRRDSRRDEREGQGRKRKIFESEETEEIKSLPLYPYMCKDSRTCPTVSQFLCHLPEKRRREIEEIVEEMKERDRGEKEKYLKGKKQKK